MTNQRFLLVVRYIDRSWKMKRYVSHAEIEKTIITKNNGAVATENAGMITMQERESGEEGTDRWED